METATKAPVSLTKGAVEEVRRLMGDTSSGYKPGQYLRVGVKGGGCSGMTYILGFDEREEDDNLYDIEGIPVIMKNAHGLYLFGIEVDFQEGLNARGFVFNNPNASSTCGCGTSFAV